jgi:hypothetical protein
MADQTNIVQTNIFGFIQKPDKLALLTKVNELLNLNKFPHNKLVFVYSAPKVGSTSIVSSLRIFGSNKFNTIHIHDEEMLKVLGHVSGVSVNEIILFNKYLGKEVYVIDVYRSPIERKISTYFEKIGSHHFNNVDEKVNQYNLNKIINRFNKIFLHIGNGDHFYDKYDIKIPDKFDFTKRYLLLEENGIKYIKLRLKDSNNWGQILTNIFGTRIYIVKDYESRNKPIRDLYTSFKYNYSIPKNLLDEVMKCKYLNYFYSDTERSVYHNEWLKKSTGTFDSYSLEQYNLYQELTIENSHIDYIQTNHYIDEGCLCKACVLKRGDVASKIMKGIHNNERIIHNNAKQELINKRAAQVNKINAAIQKIPVNNTNKNYRSTIKNISAIMGSRR